MFNNYDPRLNDAGSYRQRRSDLMGQPPMMIPPPMPGGAAPSYGGGGPAPYGGHHMAGGPRVGGRGVGLSRKGLGRGEYVQKHAPEYCEVTVVYDGKKILKELPHSKSSTTSNQRPHSERNFFECVCFSGKFT
ncbi:hypothetical protein CDL12_06100 [Handroanthus impetiginosus]|uniref:Uncharacterized protein n=1 Tax=Handroanthus impetiginosus TaxID=429701 RepID=A0A2G9HUM6_9LAMI|nr:hypothetical protein CDL12_06100 [Handroanthus impetiginosus]